MLFRFLYRNFKGYRLLVVLAILVTIAQVGSDLLVGLPLKFIPSKVNNPGNDPACQLPILDPILIRFDTRFLDKSLQDPTNPNLDIPPPTSQCPVTNPNDLNAVAHPRTTSHSVIGVIVFSLLLLIICSLLSAGLGYLDLFLASYIAYNLSARLRNHLFEHLQRISLDWHGKQKKGDLVQRVTGNVADIEKFVTDGLADLLGSFLILIGVTVIMWNINPQYTILSLAIAPPLFIVVILYTRSIKAAAKKASKTAGQVADVATEDINALTVIKVFTREDREAMRFGGRVSENRAAGLRAGGLQAQLAPLVAILLAIGNAIVIGVGGYVAAGFPINIVIFNVVIFQIPAESFDIGALVAFLFYLNKLYQPMRDISKLTTLMSNAASGVERIQEVLDQAPEVVETQAPYNGPRKLRGEIIFDNVVFGYSPERPILKGINLQIPSGKRVALVGLSGGGKTTLVKLIPRFYEIQQGSVRIDGVDNRMYPLAVLRQNVSMVLQDSVLFEGTIRENIAIGKPGANDDEIIDAAKKAQMHETIIDLPGGYNTLVREQGKNFSGGQRQRLAIARAILRDAPILILDEPTASLDVEAEAEVMHALDKLIAGRTVLVISHRLSTLGNVDEVIVLKDGRVAEQGTFKDLKRRGGIFAGLLEEQNRYNADRVGEQSIIRSAFIPPDYQRPAVQPTPPPNRVPPAAYAPGNAQPQFMFDGRPLVQQPQVLPVTLPREARLLIELDGKIIGQRSLDKPILTIGRLTGNDMQIPNQRVSRLHAKIRQENGTWIIEDADSVNGIIYKGNRVERLALTNGDRIHIAPTVVLHYEAKA